MELFNTPSGWTRISMVDDVLDAETLTEFAPVGNGGVYFQTMRQSAEYTEGNGYESNRWYLLLVSKDAQHGTEIQAIYAKDAATQPYFPVNVTLSSNSTTTTGGGTTTAQPSVTAVQQALNAKYNAKLNVDNKWGPNTCKAAFAFQKNVVGVTGTSKLTTAFFRNLDLPEEWVNTFGSACVSYYSGSGGGTSTVKTYSKTCPNGTKLTWTSAQTEPTCPDAPVPSTFPWLSTLVGAAGGSLIGLAGKKTVLKKKPKVKTWHAAVGGALLGALGGFFVGKARQ